MDRQILTATLRRLRPLPTLVKTFLTLPFQATIALVEWIVTEMLARLIVLPLVLAFHVRRHAINARRRAEWLITIERAPEATLPIEVAASARRRHFEHVLATITGIDRERARHTPIHPEADEASLAAFEEAIRQLRAIAINPEIQEHIDARLTAFFEDSRPAA